jgi:UDP-glucose 4-epimerase
MTILVTGGTGLVGSRLLHRLVTAGIACRALVRPGKDLPGGVTRVEGDILDPATLGPAVAGVSAIVHLAAVFRTPNPEDIWAANRDGTRNLISAVVQHAPQARFIMSSTSNIYNADSPRPGREDDAVDPKQDYPASKAIAETDLRNSGLDWSILRFGFVYGDKDGHIESLPKLAVAHKMHPATRMSMIHHRDIATIVQLALAGAMDGRVVNCTDDAPISIYDLCALVGEPIPASGDPLPYPWRLQMDGALARSLGFVPTVATTFQAAREAIL